MTSTKENKNIKKIVWLKTPLHVMLLGEHHGIEIRPSLFACRVIFLRKELSPAKQEE